MVFSRMLVWMVAEEQANLFICGEAAKSATQLSGDPLRLGGGGQAER
jgi:hypothetical protein